MTRVFFYITATLAALCTPILAQDTGSKAKIKVFILAGQSNMQGHGRISMNKDGDLDYAAAQQQFAYLKRDGEWVERKDVWYFHKPGRGSVIKCNLRVGLGANAKSIGPELTFGHLLGEHYKSQVLLIKTAWGGQALAATFRPPSSKLPEHATLQAMLAKKKKKNPNASLDDIKQQFGSRYRSMLEEVQMVLGNLKKHFPSYRGQGYEIVGFLWHQGWNDACSKNFAKEYEANMSNFIVDLRKDLGVKNLPFVIATSGMGGPKASGVAGFLGKSIEPQQIAAAARHKRCTAVPTRHFQIHKPGRQKSHWHNSAESYCLVGDASAQAMIKILVGKK